MGSFAPHFRCDAERRTVKDEIAVFAILRLFCPLARIVLSCAAVSCVVQLLGLIFGYSRWIKQCHDQAIIMSSRKCVLSFVRNPIA